MLRGLGHLSYEGAAGAGSVLSREGREGIPLMHINISMMGA